MLEAIPIVVRGGVAILVLLATMQFEAALPRVGGLLGGVGTYLFLLLVREVWLMSSLLLASQLLLLFYAEQTILSYVPFVLLVSLLLLPQGGDDDDRPTINLYEREIRRLFWRFDPAKAHLVDQLLRENRGQEMNLLRSLRREYGEPDDTVDDLLVKGLGEDASHLREPTPEQICSDISKLVHEKDSKNVKHLPAVLQRYQGREKELLTELCRDYKTALPAYLAAAPISATRGQYKPWTLEGDKVLEEEKLKAREAVRKNLGAVSARLV